jgi:broad specificity phosphatase PhoE
VFVVSFLTLVVNSPLRRQTRHPEEFAKRTADKLAYRYPGAAGESYLDVIERVRPVIIELERQRRSIVIVCHLAVLR